VWTCTAALLGRIDAFVGGVAARVDSMSAADSMIRAIPRGTLDPEQMITPLTELAAGFARACMSLVCIAVFVLTGTVSRRAGAARRTELLENLGVSMEPPRQR